MTPQAESILEIFKSTGAYLQGHFRLTSGLHSAEYLQCALVLQHPAAEKLGRVLAEQLREYASALSDFCEFDSRFSSVICTCLLPT